MTKREVLQGAIDFMDDAKNQEDFPVDDCPFDEIMAGLKAQLASASKKSNSVSAVAAARKAADDTTKAAILAVLPAPGEEGTRVKTLIENHPEFGSSQKVTALMRALVTEGKATRDESKKFATFTLA